MIRLLAATTAIAALAMLPLPATAGPADVAFLQSFIGNYVGASTLSGPKPQKVKCRLTLASGNSGKVTYTGRCSVDQGTFSMTGVFAYVGNHYEAAMSGTGGLSGTSIGQKKGSGLVFSTKGHDTTQGGDRTISSSLTLAGGTIKVDFTMLDNKTGKTTTGSIPFAKS